MTLYLKYRPKNLEELDLRDVAESLEKIFSKKSFPHAFLFAGPKGTGKTSAARILAKIINCTDLQGSEPCNKCAQCVSIDKGTNLDVIEMDAASHRGIDDVRVLRDAVKLAPVAAKKKIYIIDEAHMLTTEASNALLKTLEEPPDHVIFILATTNPEKLIDTIRSRTTLIPFRKANTEEVKRSLKRVIAAEKMKINDDALGVISEASGGSFRDAIKILEQLSAEEKELTKEFLEEFLFKKKDFDLDNIVSLLTKKDVKGLIEEIGKLGSKGVAIENFLESLLKKLESSLLAKVGVGNDDIKEIDKENLINLIELLEEASRKTKDSLIEELPLEIAIIKYSSPHAGQNSHAADPPSQIDPVNEPPVKDFDAQTVVPSVHSSSSAEAKMVEDDTGLTIGVGEIGVNDDAWKSILALIKPINASIEALLRASKPVAYDGKILTLGVYYKFHKERLEDVHHKRVVEDIVAKVLGSVTRITCVLVDPPPKKIVEEVKVEAVLTEGKDRDIIRVAEEIFGN